MRNTGAPVVFDVTHSVQKPGGHGHQQRRRSAKWCRCWPAPRVARGRGRPFFMETHPDPKNAMSDGPNAVPLKHMKALLEHLVALDRELKTQRLLKNDFSC